VKRDPAAIPYAEQLRIALAFMREVRIFLGRVHQILDEELPESVEDKGEGSQRHG
jgi:hypothetical protein